MYLSIIFLDTPLSKRIYDHTLYVLVHVDNEETYATLAFYQFS